MNSKSLSGFGPVGTNGNAPPVDDGGPAFPECVQTLLGPGIQHGMSLRDYFAGQVIAGPMVHLSEHNYSDAAKVAYALADAMLAERAKGAAK